MPEQLEHWFQALVFDQQSVGSNTGRAHLLRKIKEVVLSALPARLQTADTQAYIRLDCKR